MRRKRLAAKILAVIMAVTACVSVNDTALIAMAAESADSETASVEEKATNEDNVGVGTTSEDTGTDADTGLTESDISVGVGGTDDVTSSTAGDSDATAAEENAEVEGTIDDSAVSNEGKTAEETATVDEKQATDDSDVDTDDSTSDEILPVAYESSEQASTTDEEQAAEEAADQAAEQAPEEELPEMIEIIDSEGVMAGGGRKMAGNRSASSEDILNAEVIDADVSTASSGCVLAGVYGEYITDSEAALARINEIRLEACKEGVRNPDTGKPLTEADYVPIKWSGDLEYIARIRAAESAFTVGHSRLNGQDIWGVTSPSGVRSYGEVLAWNWSESMINGINQWYREKADWVNQTEGAVTGHYTQMIDPTHLYVGIATFCSDDASYYNTTAGEFTSKSGLSETPMDMSGYCVQMLDVALDKVSSDGEIMGTLYGAKGSTGRLLLSGTMSARSTAPIYFLNGVDWSSSNTAVVTVAADGTTTAVGSGTATIQASAAGGSVTATAEFNVKSIEDCDITLAQTSYTYDGSEKKPAVTASYHGTALKAGTDYTVSYTDNVDAGTATVTITGSEEYAGTVEKTFTIRKAAQSPSAEDVSVAFGSSAKIAVSGAQGNITYQSQNTSVATVTADGTVTGVKAGATGVTVLADGGANYEAASVSVEVVVTPVSLTDARIEVRLSETEFTYDGREHKPSVKIQCDGADLAEGTDYVLEWGESTNAGQKSVKITGAGNYAGEVTKNYKILKAAQSPSAQDVSVEFGGNAEAVMNGARGNVHFVSRDESVATVSADGVVKGTGAGTTTIDVTADGNENYEKGTTSFVVTVTAVDISDSTRAAVSLSADSFVYNGREQKPVVTVVCDGADLAEGTDYVLEWGESTNAGQKSVKITGAGNYAGEVTKNYKILKAAQTLTAKDLRIYLAETGKIKVDGAHTALTFESQDPSVATVDADGTVQGVGVGETVVSILTKEDENYEAAEAQVRVTTLKLRQNLAISASTFKMDAGKDGSITVTGAVGQVSAKVSVNGIVKELAVTAVKSEEGTYKIEFTGSKVGKTELIVTAAEDSRHEEAVVRCNIWVRPKATSSFKAAAAADGKGIKLTWAKVAGATNYVIYRNGKPIKTVGNIASWTDTGANSNGAKYTFKICASASTGESKSAKSVVYYKLNRPAKPKVTNSATRKMTVKWSKNAKANGYQIQYSPKSNFSSAKSVSVKKAGIVTKVIGNLAKGKIYYVRVRSYKKAGGKYYYSAWSARKAVKISK